MTIALDVDGVLADLCTSWLNQYNKDYNDNLKPEDIHSWDTHLYVKPECGIKIYDYIKKASIYKKVKPIKGSQNAVRKIREAGEPILFVTTFEPRFSYAKYQWLIDYDFLKNKKEYIECSDKSLIIADCLIDDNFINASTFPKLGILFDSPWNRNEDYKIRLYGWERFNEYFGKDKLL